MPGFSINVHFGSTCDGECVCSIVVNCAKVHRYSKTSVLKTEVNRLQLRMAERNDIIYVYIYLDCDDTNLDEYVSQIIRHFYILVFIYYISAQANFSYHNSMIIYTMYPTRNFISLAQIILLNIFNYNW